MKCSRCENEARGVCRWCGRGLCNDHEVLQNYILTVYVGAKKIPKGLMVADALWCGICKRQPQPIEMEYLD
jgi:hypothetical protein